jgi:putative nucleotidyltransferase with HDIG domain
LVVVAVGLLVGVIYLIKKISNTAISKLAEYTDKIDSLMGELEIKVEERTAELSETVGKLKEQITERKRAEDVIQLQLSRLNVLHSIETAINSSHEDLTSTLNHIVDQVTMQLGINAATILLLNQDTQILEYAVSKGIRSNALKYTRLRLGESNAGRAAVERRIIAISNLVEEPSGFTRSELFAKEGFVSYFAVPLIAKGEIKGVLELFHRVTLGTDPEWMDYIDTIANQAALAIDKAALLEGLQQSNINITVAYDSTIEGWSHALDMKDEETEGHSRRVTEMTLRIAEKIGLKNEKLIDVRRGALLHDIGKMGIPDSILLKPGKLTDEEWIIMKQHPVYALDMLYPIDYLRASLDIPYCHHEKWDGTGYPRGLKGEEIPLSARIFAIVDVWDALMSDRPYRPAWAKEKVIEHIRSLSNVQFDPRVVEVFLENMDIVPEYTAAYNVENKA